MNTNLIGMRAGEFALDLRQWVGNEKLISIILTRIQQKHEQLKRFAPFSSGLRAPLLLTVLTYAYARNILDANEIQRGTRDHGWLSYLCRTQPVDALVLRVFRRAARQELKEVLAEVLVDCWSARFGSQATSSMVQCAEADAEERIRSAILADSVALDF